MKWNPRFHPRNRVGKFIDVLNHLKDGGSVDLPDGTTVTRSGDSFQVRGGGQRSRGLTARRAAEQALDGSARGSHPDSLGGRTRFQSVAGFEAAQGQRPARLRMTRTGRVQGGQMVVVPGKGPAITKPFRAYDPQMGGDKVQVVPIQPERFGAAPHTKDKATAVEVPIALVHPVVDDPAMNVADEMAAALEDRPSKARNEDDAYDEVAGVVSQVADQFGAEADGTSLVLPDGRTVDVSMSSGVRVEPPAAADLQHVIVDGDGFPVIGPNDEALPAVASVDRARARGAVPGHKGYEVSTVYRDGNPVVKARHAFLDDAVAHETALENTNPAGAHLIGDVDDPERGYLSADIGERDKVSTDAPGIEAVNVLTDPVAALQANGWDKSPTGNMAEKRLADGYLVIVNRTNWSIMSPGGAIVEQGPTGDGSALRAAVFPRDPSAVGVLSYIEPPVPQSPGSEPFFTDAHDWRPSMDGPPPVDGDGEVLRQGDLVDLPGGALTARITEFAQGGVVVKTEEGDEQHYRAEQLMKIAGLPAPPQSPGSGEAQPVTDKRGLINALERGRVDDSFSYKNVTVIKTDSGFDVWRGDQFLAQSVGQKEAVELSGVPDGSGVPVDMAGVMEVLPEGGFGDLPGGYSIRKAPYGGHPVLYKGDEPIYDSDQHGRFGDSLEDTYAKAIGAAIPGDWGFRDAVLFDQGKHDAAAGSMPEPPQSPGSGGNNLPVAPLRRGMSGALGSPVVAKSAVEAERKAIQLRSDLKTAEGKLAQAKLNGHQKSIRDNAAVVSGWRGKLNAFLQTWPDLNVPQSPGSGEFLAARKAADGSWKYENNTAGSIAQKLAAMTPGTPEYKALNTPGTPEYEARLAQLKEWGIGPNSPYHPEYRGPSVGMSVKANDGQDGFVKGVGSDGKLDVELFDGTVLLGQDPADWDPMPPQSPGTPGDHVYMNLDGYGTVPGRVVGPDANDPTRLRVQVYGPQVFPATITRDQIVSSTPSDFPPNQIAMPQSPGSWPGTDPRTQALSDAELTKQIEWADTVEAQGTSLTNEEQARWTAVRDEQLRRRLGGERIPQTPGSGDVEAERRKGMSALTKVVKGAYRVNDTGLKRQRANTAAAKLKDDELIAAAKRDAEFPSYPSGSADAAGREAITNELRRRGLEPGVPQSPGAVAGAGFRRTDLDVQDAERGLLRAQFEGGDVIAAQARLDAALAARDAARNKVTSAVKRALTPTLAEAQAEVDAAWARIEAGDTSDDAATLFEGASDLLSELKRLR